MVSVTTVGSRQGDLRQGSPHHRFAHVWKWPDLYDAIQTVANMHGLDGKAERRVLRLINPAYLNQPNRRQRTTTHTMLMTLQLLKPGEVAHDHRHNFAAFRFILKGSGAYTVVEGEQIPMQEGDLILIPSMTWHGHRPKTKRFFSR